MYADWRAIQNLINSSYLTPPKTYGIAIVNMKHKRRGGWKRR